MQVIDLDNQTDIEINISNLEDIAQYFTTNVIELIVTDNKTMQALNKEHRSKDRATDVLSFPIDSLYNGEAIPGMPLGSIVISADFVKEKSTEYGHMAEDELSLLFIHGLLHLLGYDHETDNGEMRKREKDTIEIFNLPKSLIVRTEES